MFDVPSDIINLPFINQSITFLSGSPTDVAQQITLYDHAMFAHLEPREFVDCAWMKKEKATLAPTITALTQRFNHLSNYVTKCILLTTVIFL
jgi:hypothetical protein